MPFNSHSCCGGSANVNICFKAVLNKGKNTSTMLKRNYLSNTVKWVGVGVGAIVGLGLRVDVNPRPAGPLDFPPPAGGGGGVFEHPPSISAPAHRRTKRKTAFESSRKIVSKSFRSFFGSSQN